MVKINVKRFSRSKFDENDNEIVENPIIIEKKTRGRKKKVTIQEEEPIIEQEPEQIIEEPVYEEDSPIVESFDDNNFLSELNNSNFKIEEEEDKNKENNLKLERERVKQQTILMRQAEKEGIKQEKLNQAKINNDVELYSDNAESPQGSEKILLLHKIKQYKNLFNEELKNYKIKPNCSIPELKAYIDDIDVIISSSNVDSFITDSILQCLKLLELPTSKTKYFNISGLSDLLKSNKEFHSLTKQLYIKYGVFNKIPVEYQLTILISTTSYICININKNKDSLEAYLNEPILNK